MDFSDEGTNVIHNDKIVECSVDGKCKVIWSDDEEYEADLLFTGYVHV